MKITSLPASFLHWVGSLLGLALLSGCVTHDQLLNFTKGEPFPDQPEAILNYHRITIQPEDILSIFVSAADPEAAQPFNMGTGLNMGMMGMQGMQMSGYLVDANGVIDFPGLGNIEVGGLTLEEARLKVREGLKEFLVEPSVNLRIMNFRIHVLGEVGRPGVLNLSNERLSVLEALAMSGDIGPYGRRDSILIVRELEGERSFAWVDVDSREIFRSPYFYLKQNDLIYVEPIQAKTTTLRDPATRVLPWVSVVTSLVAFALSIFRN